MESILTELNCFDPSPSFMKLICFALILEGNEIEKHSGFDDHLALN